MTTTGLMSIAEKQNELIESFEFLSNWTEKYEHIIALGKSLQPMTEELKTDDNLIRGCQSKVWLSAELIEDRVRFYADSDAIITKGLISMFISIYSDQKAEDIVNSDLLFIDKIGLKEHLSPTRSNGLLSMVKQIKFYALAMQGKK